LNQVSADYCRQAADGCTIPLAKILFFVSLTKYITIYILTTDKKNEVYVFRKLESGTVRDLHLMMVKPSWTTKLWLLWDKAI